MSNDPFKYITQKDFEEAGSPIMFFITEEQIQDFAEDNYPPRLSEEELDELASSGAIGLYDGMNDLMYHAIKEIRGDNK